MRRSARKTSKHTNSSQSALIKRRLITILGFLIVVSIGVQFLVLAGIGTTGPKLTNLRVETEEIQLQNELKLSEIRSKRTTRDISEVAVNELGMQGTDLEIIYVFDEEGLAQASNAR